VLPFAIKEKAVANNMPPEEEKGAEDASSGPSSSQTHENSEKHSLLMRFFESDFFDAWIAVT